MSIWVELMLITSFMMLYKGNLGTSLIDDLVPSFCSIFISFFIILSIFLYLYHDNRVAHSPE